MPRAVARTRQPLSGLLFRSLSSLNDDIERPVVKENILPVSCDCK